MKTLLLKLAAYFTLLFGILLGVVAILGAIALFVSYPEANNIKVTLVAIGLIVFAVVIGLIGFAFFETFMDNVEEKEREGNPDPRQWQGRKYGNQSTQGTNSR